MGWVSMGPVTVELKLAEMPVEIKSVRSKH